MEATRRPLTASDRGFSMVEMLVTLTVMALMLVVMYGTFFGAQKAFMRTSKISESRLATRAAVQLMERDVRMAGSGWGPLLINTASGGGNSSYYAVNSGYRAAGNDSFSIVGSWGASTTLRAAMATSSSTINCQSTTGFATNDLVLISNGNQVHLFQATGVGASPADIAHATTSNWNNGGHANWPSGGFKIGADVYKVSFVTYRVDSVNFRKRSVVRQEVGGTPQLICYNVKDMTVWYQLQDGSWTRNPADPKTIDKVVPVVHTFVGTPARLDSAWAAIHPRTY